VDNLLNEDSDKKEEFRYPEYAAMLCDERDHVKYSIEGLFAGTLFEGSKERWGYYKAYDLEFPSDEELKHMKGLIIPGSKHSAYDDS
jgi:hypothetical protein